VVGYDATNAQYDRIGRIQIVAQVRQVLESEFPGMLLKLEDMEGSRIFGDAVWAGFGGYDIVDRQTMLRDALRAALGNEGRGVGVLLTYTPDEPRAATAA